MKRLLVLFAIMALIFVPAIVMAYNDGEDLPSGAVEVEHWELIGGVWVHRAPQSALSLARCWKSGDGVQGNCNRENYSLEFTNHASMAQWCDLDVTESRYDWRILKPGTYAADCITIKIKSNNDVQLTYSGFGDLQYQEPGAGVKQTIDTYYAVAQSIPDATSADWKRASTLNGAKLLLDSQKLHDGYNMKLYNMIFVENCNSSCEYENVGTVDIKLMNIKRWVDASDTGYLRGFWKDLPMPQSPDEDE